jgi:hypothetical protein
MENGADAHAFVVPLWKHDLGNGQEYHQAFLVLHFLSQMPVAAGPFLCGIKRRIPAHNFRKSIARSAH